MPRPRIRAMTHRTPVADSTRGSPRHLTDAVPLQRLSPGASPNDPLDVHTFNEDLPSDLTAQRYALVATQGFASLPGAVEPDFVMPDGFIDTSLVVEIELGNIDEFVFPLGSLPVDGVNSLYRRGKPINPNSPTNFAGQIGSINVPEPSTALLVACGLVGLAVRRRRVA